MKLKYDGYSWHHEITHFPDLAMSGYVREHDKCKDFCSYTRWFLLKLLVVIPITVLFIGGVLGVLVSGWVDLLFIDAPSFEFFAQNHVGWVLINLILIFLLVNVGVTIAISEYKTRKAVKDIHYDYLLSRGLIEKKEPPFLCTWYRKVKDKYCPTMDY